MTKIHAQSSKDPPNLEQTVTNIFTHLQSSEMDNAVNIRMRGKDLVKGRFIGDVDAVVCRPSAGQQLDTVDNFIR
jgi:hypothetical protein